jgi:mRNA interferase HicA
LQSNEKKRIRKRLRIAGCYLKREGSSHSLWINPKTGVIEAIPRHTEIKEPLAKKILKSLNAD